MPFFKADLWSAMSWMHSGTSSSNLSVHERALALSTLSCIRQNMSGLWWHVKQHSLADTGTIVREISISVQKLAQRVLGPLASGADEMARREMLLQENKLLHGENMARLRVARTRVRLASALPAKAFPKNSPKAWILRANLEFRNPEAQCRPNYRLLSYSELWRNIQPVSDSRS